MRLTADWLARPATQAVMAAISRSGFRVLAVGGAVRDTIMGLPVTDVDLATDARPEQVIAAADAAGMKTVETGLKHGTVTVIAAGFPFEVTTFRSDVATDGRHAIVVQTDRLDEDAARRDFTMNAIYAQADGTVVDPLGGLPDAIARRVRFIGDPSARIAEDYLRILRFFRFHACLGDPALGLDAEGLAACAASVEGLARLSRERIGAEMRKLLAARDPAPVLAAMEQAGILARILPGSSSRAVAPLVHAESGLDLAPEPMRRLAVMRPDGAASRLRLSRPEQARLRRLTKAMLDDAPADETGYRLGLDEGLSVVALRAALTGTEPAPDAVTRTRLGAGARFPVKAADLAHLSGPALGEALARLERVWIDSGFRSDRRALLALAGGDKPVNLR